MCIANNTAPHYCGLCCKLRNILKIHYRQVAFKKKFASNGFVMKTNLRKTSSDQKVNSKRTRYQRKENPHNKVKPDVSLVWKIGTNCSLTKQQHERNSRSKKKIFTRTHGSTQSSQVVKYSDVGDENKCVVDWGSGVSCGKSDWDLVAGKLGQHCTPYQSAEFSNRNSNPKRTRSQRRLRAKEKSPEEAYEIKRTKRDEQCAVSVDECVETEPGSETQSKTLIQKETDKIRVNDKLEPLLVLSDLKHTFSSSIVGSVNALSELDSALPKKGNAKRVKKTHSSGRKCPKRKEKKERKKRKKKDSDDFKLKTDSGECVGQDTQQDVGQLTPDGVEQSTPESFGQCTPKSVWQVTPENVGHGTRRSAPESVGRPYCACSVCKSESCVSLDHKADEIQENNRKKTETGAPNISDEPAVKFHCELCDANFRAKYSYRKDVVKHSLDGPYHCTTCGQVFQNDLLLCNHKIIEHQWDINERVICKFCCTGFCSSTNLAKHKCKQFRQEATFVCRFCNESFFKRNLMIKHVRSLHMIGERFPCTQCSFSTLKAHLLIDHLHMHDDTPTFCCDLCGLQFRLEKDFEKHKLKHEGKKQQRAHECSYCGKCFKTPTRLKYHIRSVHLKERPHLCPFCGKGSKTSYNLKIHIETVHNNAKMFQCLFCNFAANLKCNLDAHVRKVHPDYWMGTKPDETTMLTCRHCSFTTHSEYSLNWHVGNHH